MKKLVIIGSGLAGVTLASFVKDYEITLISKENILPYYRMRIGECFKDKPIDSLFLHPFSWYEEKGIKLLMGISAEEINKENKTVKLSNGDCIAYDTLVFASGSDARKIDIKTQLPCFALRSYSDVESIKAKLSTSASIGILGGGVLGLELAVLLAEKGRSVSVIESAPYLLSRQLNEEASLFLENLLIKKGITVFKGKSVASYKDNGVVLSDGSELPLSFLCLSIGVNANIALAKECGINCNRGILIDEKFKTSADDIYAIGDCAELNGFSFGQAIYAQEMGTLLAKKLNGEDISYKPSSPSMMLKISDIPVVCFGEMRAEYKIFTNGDKLELYFLDGDIIKGVILINNNDKMVEAKAKIGKVFGL